MTFAIQRERRRREETPARGRWKVQESGVSVACPNCGNLSVFGAHEVDETGSVRRALRCTCRFFALCSLSDWGKTDEQIAAENEARKPKTPSSLLRLPIRFTPRDS